MTTCAIYIRKSREDKDKPSQRLTVQREQLPAHAKAQGWQTVIYDDGHASAAKGKVEDLQQRARLETDIRSGKIDILLCIELSRLSRDDTLQDYIAWLTLCSNHKVKLATPSRILDPAQHSDWMLLLMEGGFSSVEMKVLQGRMKEGRDQAYREGKFLGGGCPPPYKYDKATSKLVVDNDQLKTVKLVWELAETISARKIAITLGLPFISTRRMLADDRLLFYQAKRLGDEGEIIQCDWEPILDAEQAERIRAGRRMGYTGPRREAGGLLSNLSIMYCGYCGKTWRGWKGQTRKDGTFTGYYGCQGKATKGYCPKTKMIEQGIINERVMTNILGTISRLEDLRHVWETTQENGESAARLKELNQEQHKNEAAKGRLIAALAEGIIEFADAKHQLDGIKLKIETINKDRAKLLASQKTEPDWEMLREIRNILPEMDDSEKREFISLIIKQIKVFSSYLTIEYNFPRAADGSTTARIHLPSSTKRN